MNCNGKILDLSTPVVMGILNVTPDSFYDGGKYTTEKKIIEHTKKMLDEGAGIIDVGGYSSRPGAAHINEAEELKRVIPAIEIIAENFPGAIISVDTFRSNIAKKAVDSGACIINDISGGTMDDKMFQTVARLNVPYILMHIKGTPQTMQNNPVYKDVVKEIILYFAEKINELRILGAKDIILDPGFGFGKTLAHNYEILSKLSYFKIFEMPLLAGLSRKSMINEIIKKTSKFPPFGGTKGGSALNGTTAANTIALLNGAKILRVHDVKEAVEAVNLYLKTVPKPLLSENF